MRIDYDDDHVKKEERKKKKIGGGGRNKKKWIRTENENSQRKITRNISRHILSHTEKKIQKN